MSPGNLEDRLCNHEDNSVDDSLAEKAKNGDMESAATLITKYMKIVYWTSRGAGADRDTANDVISDVLYYIFIGKAINKYSINRISFKNFVRNATRWKTKDRLRRKKRRVDCEKKLYDLGDYHSLPSEPRCEIGTHEIAEIVIKIINEIQEFEPKSIIVFKLNHYNGLCFKQIGEMLGISESQASRRFQKAIKLIKSRCRQAGLTGEELAR